MTNQRLPETQTHPDATARPEQPSVAPASETGDATGRPGDEPQHTDALDADAQHTPTRSTTDTDALNILSSLGKKPTNRKRTPWDEYGEVGDFPNLAPDRPLDARWRIVCRAARAGRFSPRLDDDGWVALGLRLMRLLAGRDADRDAPTEATAALDAAYRLHQDGDMLARGFLEGLILAGESDEQIASRCRMTPLAVRAYEAMFFSIRDRLYSSAFVDEKVVGILAIVELNERNSDVVLRRAGYSGGRDVVVSMLRYYTSGYAAPGTLAGLSREQVRDLATMLRMRGLVLQWTWPATSERLLRSVRQLTALLQGYHQHLLEEEGVVPRSEGPAVGTQTWLQTWEQLVRRTRGRLTGPTTLGKGRPSRRRTAAAEEL